MVASAIERDNFVSSLAEAEGRLRKVVERLPAITYSAGLGAGGRWYFVSPQVEEIFGFTIEECLADPEWWDRQVDPEDLAWVVAEEERCAREGKALDVEYRMRDRHGRTLWIRDRASIGTRPAPEAEGGQEVVVEGLLVDITAQKLAEIKLRHDVEHDPLTGLLNRRGFERRLNAHLAGAGTRSRGCVAVIDIDDMKVLNDGFGYGTGDAFLRELARALGSFAGEDRLLARLNSDEFGLFAPSADETAARELLERAAAAVQAVPAPVSVTASAGATMVAPGRVAAELIVAADLALYGSKRGGRGRITIDPGAGESGFRWVARVREAIESHSLTVFAQPIYDLRTGELSSQELLVRMIGPDGRPIAAEQFVPAAERFGLIGEVDRFVLERAVTAVAAGHPVNVNISSASIADPSLTEVVARGLDRSRGDDPSLLTFEVTETGPTPPVEDLHAFSARVAELGCGLSLDDVGTGFGSLTYLHNVDFDQIKIDMEFVRALESPDGDEGIVRSLVAVARELGLQTVGEGVASEQVRRRLLELGVDHGQGYHLGPPAPLATIGSPWQPTSQS